MNRKLTFGFVLVIVGLPGVGPAAGQEQDILDELDRILEESGEQPVPEVAPPTDFVPIDVIPAGEEAAEEAEPMPPVFAPPDAYDVSAFRVAYTHPLPFVPNVNELYKIPIELGQVADGYVGPDEGGEPVTIRLGGPSESDPGRMLPVAFDARFSPAALRTIVQTLEQALYAPQLTNYFVALDPADVDPFTGADRRPAGRNGMGILVTFDGPTLPVSGFELEYVAGPHPGLPPTEDLLNEAEVVLVPTPTGYVSWRPGVKPVRFALSERTGALPEDFSAGAIQLVLEAVTRVLTRDIMAVQVVPAATELGTDPDGGLIDLRGDRTTLRLSIITGLVKDVRTLAAGDRIDPADRVNNPVHKWIRENSPIGPAGVEGSVATTDLLMKRELDEYLFHLSRHPGRRVDAAVARAPADLAGPLGVSLDYIVSENKPLLLYGQVSNTGTAQTDEWRYRAGLFDNQLTGRDDILTLEYLTGDPNVTNAVTGRYEAPLPQNDRVRWSINGLWSDYTASDVGFANLRFTGTTWSVGGEVAWNFFQDRQLFVDAIAGARYYNIDVENAFLFQSGSEDFLLPYVGLRLERATETATTNASLLFEFDVLSHDATQLNNLGRFLPDDDWYALKWDASHSFFLEPVLMPQAWSDPSTPGSTLAHELFVHARGQYAFNRRAVPQFEQVAGGLYTVRGYDESVAVGDSVFLATAEYRFHLPQAMGIATEPGTFMGKPFRFLPQHAYGRADWDLVLRGFCDIGRVLQSDRLGFERNQTLIGVGGGVQLLYKRNLDVRLDWGVALEEIPGVVNDGSNRLHVVATILF